MVTNGISVPNGPSWLIYLHTSPSAALRPGQQAGGRGAGGLGWPRQVRAGEAMAARATCACRAGGRCAAGRAAGTPAACLRARGVRSPGSVRARGAGSVRARRGAGARWVRAACLTDGVSLPACAPACLCCQFAAVCLCACVVCVFVRACVRACVRVRACGMWCCVAGAQEWAACWRCTGRQRYCWCAPWHR